MYFPKYNISNSIGTSPDTNPHLTIHSFNIKPLWSTFISILITSEQSQNCRSNARCSSTISSSWIVNLLVFTFNRCCLAGRPSTLNDVPLNPLHNTVTHCNTASLSMILKLEREAMIFLSSAAHAGLIHSILWMHAERERERERESESAHPVPC